MTKINHKENAAKIMAKNGWMPIKASPKELLDIIAEMHMVDVPDLLGPSRKSNLVSARKEIAVRMVFDGKKIIEVGRLLGDRKATAILNYLKDA